MTFEGEERIVARHAVTVVLDPHERAPAVAELDLHARRPGIEGVFQQLFHDRSRALDHLTSGNLVGDPVGENADFGHAWNGGQALRLTGQRRTWRAPAVPAGDATAVACSHRPFPPSLSRGFISSDSSRDQKTLPLGFRKVNCGGHPTQWVTGSEVSDWSGLDVPPMDSGTTGQMPAPFPGDAPDTPTEPQLISLPVIPFETIRSTSLGEEHPRCAHADLPRQGIEKSEQQARARGCTLRVGLGRGKKRGLERFVVARLARGETGRVWRDAGPCSHEQGDYAATTTPRTRVT